MGHVKRCIKGYAFHAVDYGDFRMILKANIKDTVHFTPLTCSAIYHFRYFSLSCCVCCFSVCLPLAITELDGTLLKLFKAQNETCQ